MESAVYIESEGVHISLKEDQLVVTKEEVRRHIPLKLIDSLIIRGNTTITSNILVKLINSGIKITFLGYYGNYNCSIYPEIHGNIETRHKQLRLSDNKEDALKLAIEIVRGKICNQLSVINRYIRNYGTTTELIEYIQRIESNLEKLIIAQGIQQIMGYEGASSKEYFKSFNSLIRSDQFKWEGRGYKPPRDEINAIISFTYSLLRSEVEKCINIHGLDPFVGFLHSERSGKVSLALDMMEEFRPFLADRLAISMIDNRQIKIDMFERKDGGVYCNNTCRELIIRQWEKRKQEKLDYKGKNMTYQEIIDYQIRLLVRHIKGIDTYKAFIWR